MKESDFLNRLIKEFPTFEFQIGMCCSQCKIDARLDLPYYLTIAEDMCINGKYQILATCKRTGRQQSEVQVDEQFILNSIRNFMVLGF